jgi:hypothetical protein
MKTRGPVASNKSGLSWIPTDRTTCSSISPQGPQAASAEATRYGSISFLESQQTESGTEASADLNHDKASIKQPSSRGALKNGILPFNLAELAKKSAKAADKDQGRLVRRIPTDNVENANIDI